MERTQEGKGDLLRHFRAFVDAEVAFRSPSSLKRMSLELVSGDASELPRMLIWDVDTVMNELV